MGSSSVSSSGSYQRPVERNLSHHQVRRPRNHLPLGGGAPASALHRGFPGPNPVQWQSVSYNQYHTAHPEDLPVELRHGMAVEHQQVVDHELCRQPRLQPHLPHQHQRGSSESAVVQRHLGLRYRINRQLRRAYPIYQQINGNLYQAISNYNSLQTTITKRLQHGLSFSANYTWSHFLDDQDSSGWGTHAGPQPYQYASTLTVNNSGKNYGNSNFDVRNSFKGFVRLSTPLRQRQGVPE